MTDDITTQELNEKLITYCGSETRARFFLAWLRNDMDAKAAYLELHPDVTEGSAKVLGHRMLTKVNRQAVLAAYGLGEETYFEKLKEGLDAMTVKGGQNDFVEIPDHHARRKYHEALGKILGIEGKEAAAPGNVVINNLIQNTAEYR